MRIAICDDERTALDTLSALTEDYILETGHALGYETFDSYEALQNRVDDFDVFLMDYKMPGTDGMTFARGLREACQNKPIIFVTAYDDFVLEAFTVQAHRFLMKPVSREKFFEALDSLWNVRQMSGQFVVKTGDTTDVIDLRDVYFFQVLRKEVYICTEREQIICRRSMDSLQQELEPLGFFRAHRSYLVNLRNIKSFNSRFAVFPNGECIPIGTRRYADFCRAYLHEAS